MQNSLITSIPYDILHEIIFHLPPKSQLIMCCVNKLVNRMRLTNWLCANNFAIEFTHKFTNQRIINMAKSVKKNQAKFLAWAYSSSYYNNVSREQWITRYYMAVLEEIIGCGYSKDYPYNYYATPQEFLSRSRSINNNKEYNILRNIKHLKIQRYYQIFKSNTLRALID